MNARVQKWGNSLALRIPKAYATELGLAADNLVDIQLVEGCLVVTPVADAAPTLEALLAQIDDSRLHGEVDTGLAVGSEAW